MTMQVVVKMLPDSYDFQRQYVLDVDSRATAADVQRRITELEGIPGRASWGPVYCLQHQDTILQRHIPLRGQGVGNESVISVRASLCLRCLSPVAGGASAAGNTH